MQNHKKEIFDPMNWSEYAEYLDKQFEKEDQKKSEVKKNHQRLKLGEIERQCYNIIARLDRPYF